MPDQRSVMKEFRSLDQKRAAEGLSPDEEARHAELRELMGPEAGAGGLRGGFDVNAAAARLRESLVPAGVRRAPPAAEPEPAPPPEPELSAADALASAYDADPFAPLDPDVAADALFDPATLDGAPPPGDAGVLPAEWDPEAARDPSALSDPAAQPYADTGLGWDAASTWQESEGVAAGEPGAQEAYGAGGADAAPAWDAAQPLDPDVPPTWDASQVDPNAAYAAPPYDPGAPAYDPNAPPAWDPHAPFDPSAAPAWDPNAPFDPSAPYPGAPDDPGAAAAYDPNAAPGWSPDAPLDPNASPAWDASQPFDPDAPYAAAPGDPSAAAYDPDAPGYEPGAPAAWDPNAPLADDLATTAQGDAALDAFAADAGAAAAEDAAGWDPSAALAPDAGALDVGALLGEPEPEGAAAAPHADPDALAPEGWDLAGPLPEPAPANAPLGEYDETASALPPGEDAGLESMLPLDPGAEALLPGDATEPMGAPALGEYDDAAAFSGTAFPDVAPADLPVEGEGFEAARVIAPAASEGWHPEPAVDEGFLLESGGSFDAAAAAVAPEWAVAGEAAPWESPVVEAAALPAEASPAQEPAAAPVFDDAQEPAAAPVYDAAEDAPSPGLALAEPDASAPQPEPSLAPAEPAPLVVAELPSFDVDVDVDLAGADGFGAPPAEPAPAFDAGAAEIAPPDGDLAIDADASAADVSGPAPALDFSRPDLSEGQPEDDFATPSQAAPAPSAADAAAASEDDVPTIDGEEILEEIPADEAAPAQPLDFEPLVVAAPPPAAALVPPPPPPPPPAAAAPDPGPPQPPTSAPERFVEGVHRVVVHTVEGQVRRGVLEDADLAAPSLGLRPAAGAAPELVGTEKVKAIFFMLAPGEKPPAPEGKKVRVTFRDGRQIAGFSPDYDETGPGFFMVPGDTRTNTGRIWVYRASAKQVSVT